ncbi:cyclic lactone autoinducer peptide [Ruminococcus sp.]|uniref:cyclic lactone autoinducer peptide n=1 Tax=Ruminococcus sp. TaxID=41978 RepID=UPI002C95960B|nr:cyclic lactone autoinducer peptide [Ruminococcus sp.]HNZ99884.1 cyclic lactone autoinducer peptide [Ruminococcus sp.]HOH87437.1 cyclic lactone autoinducer peptide [Ruminococcus sp.]
MKRIREFLLKHGNVIAALAIAAATESASKACWFWFNQPKVPEGMKKFVKEA